MKLIKICPKCGSTNVDVNPESNNLFFATLSADFYCFDCKYVGRMPDIEREGIEEFKKQLKENEKEK